MLQLLPGNDTNGSLGMALSMNASGAPGWLAGLDHHLSALVPYDGISLVLDLVVLQAVVGLAVLAGRRTRRAAVLGGIVLALAFWVTGQGLGQFWSGISTDPNTAPLLILLGVTVLGAGPWRPPTMQADTLRCSAKGLPRARKQLAERDLRGPLGPACHAERDLPASERVGSGVYLAWPPTSLHDPVTTGPGTLVKSRVGVLTDRTTCVVENTDPRGWHWPGGYCGMSAPIGSPATCVYEFQLMLHAARSGQG
jgi:uncharacterized membrane protein YphA (DoxX/SURF4 family)